MEGISLPKFLLLNKMSFLVLLTIYPLYRQAEDYSDYRFSESIHWSLSVSYTHLDVYKRQLFRF